MEHLLNAIFYYHLVSHLIYPKDQDHALSGLFHTQHSYRIEHSVREEKFSSILLGLIVNLEGLICEVN